MIDRETFVQEWVKDLRSGEYQQCLGSLGNDQISPTAFCCLGVACKTAKRLGLNFLGSEPNWERDFPSEEFESIMGDCNPDIEIEGEFIGCSYANDQMKLTFMQIANALEDTYVHDC